MYFRLASCLLMGALLASAVPAASFTGPVQNGCLVVEQRGTENTTQPCLPASLSSAAGQHHGVPPAHHEAAAAAAPGENIVFYPLYLRSPGPFRPFPNAALCPDSGAQHNHSQFHTLWDGGRGCHYDHEHGQDPFTAQVAATFVDFDLQALLGSAQVGHTNPSSPAENTHKHGGFKWNVQLQHPENCAGFEGATFGANASVVQYHAFGDEAIELEARLHSTVALVRQCASVNPRDYGYLFVVQFQDYGQRVVPYQGTVVAYPNQPDPSFGSNLGPYISTDCVGPVIQCRVSLLDVLQHRRDVNSNWTSKPPRRLVNSGSWLFQLLFRLRDGYRLFDWNDQEHPFTYLWLCSNDQGLTYDPSGCRYNNATTQVHEIAGQVPSEWDNLAGFDTDNRAGRITAQGFVTRFGDLNPACTGPSTDADCFPIKLVRAFVGSWGSVLVYTEHKERNLVPFEPSRNIFFCGELVCAESDYGAAASGWIGTEN